MVTLCTLIDHASLLSIVLWNYLMIIIFYELMRLEKLPKFFFYIKLLRLTKSSKAGFWKYNGLIVIHHCNFFVINRCLVAREIRRRQVLKNIFVEFFEGRRINRWKIFPQLCSYITAEKVAIGAYILLIWMFSFDSCPWILLLVHLNTRSVHTIR